MISGLFIIVLMLSFICITVWAWSRNNQARFESASMLPLQDEPQTGRAAAPGRGGKGALQ